MNVVLSAWFDNNIYSCTIAYTRFGAGQGNRLYVAKTTSGYTDTKTYDFDNDLMIMTNGKARTCKTIKGIPESEKVDPFFPVAFKSSDGKKIFDEPNSLIRFVGDKRSMTESPIQANEWKTEVTVTIDNQVNHCGLVSIWSENGTVTPLCDRKNENHGACPPVPMDSRIDCEGKEINYLFSDYTEYLDYSIFEEPVGFFCEGASRTPLPKLPTLFSFSAETWTDGYQEVERTRVWYDYNSLLVAREKYSLSADQLRERTVYDYTTGNKYVVFPDTYTCSRDVMVQEEVAFPSDQYVLWGMDKTSVFQKTGMRPCRSWDCAVFAGRNPVDGQPDKSQVTNLYYAYGEDDTQAASLPVYMEHFDETQSGRRVQARQIFDFRKNESSLPAFDISACYKPFETKLLALQIEGPDLVHPGRETLHKFARVLKARLLEVMSISQPLRITRVAVLPRRSDLVNVLATLLPEEKTEYTVVKDVTVDEALRRLNASIEANDFTINFNVDGVSPSVFKVRRMGALSPTKLAPQGHSSGSMAALGIMMLLLGAAIAVGVVVLVIRRYPKSNMTTILLREQA